MIVDKETFKQLKKEGGGLGGTDCVVSGNYVSGLYDIKQNTPGVINVRENGVFFDIVFGEKLFVSIDKITSVEIVNGIVEIHMIENDADVTPLSFKIDKEFERNQLYNSIMTRIGAIGTNGLRATNKSEKREQLEAEGEIVCPKCLSTKITDHKKGFGVGKALVGGLAAGPLGLLAGGIGKNKIELTCLKCGHKFKPGS